MSKAMRLLDLVTADLGEASFRGEVDAQEDCVQGTHSEIRCLFHYRRKEKEGRRRKMSAEAGQFWGCVGCLQTL